ncbi:MAG TPA: hypothetical protein VLH13_00635 [Methanomassiliicoccales archaeon]|nr:hypothetical protein [Methanomassiliicoccales archaeon]
MLETIGAKIPGGKRPFYLHEGAKSGMVQTLLAMGTVFLIERIAITEVGAEAIVTRFIPYIAGLFVISWFFSFIYFNYFERGYLNSLQVRMEKENIHLVRLDGL